MPRFCSPSGKFSCSLQPAWRHFNNPFWARIWPVTYTSSLASDLLNLSLPVCLWRITKRREAGRRRKGRVEGGCILLRAQPGLHCEQEWPITGRFGTCPANHLTLVKRLQQQRKTALLKRSKTERGRRADSTVLHNISYPRNV